MNAETNSADVAGHVARLQSELDVLSACIGEGEGDRLGEGERDRPFSPQSAENVRGLVLDAHIDWLSGACLSVQRNRGGSEQRRGQSQQHGGHTRRETAQFMGTLCKQANKCQHLNSNILTHVLHIII